MKREVYSCDHCKKDIIGLANSIVAFGYVYHVCDDCAHKFEMWIKPDMAKLVFGVDEEVELNEDEMDEGNNHYEPEIKNGW